MLANIAMILKVLKVGGLLVDEYQLKYYAIVKPICILHCVFKSVWAKLISLTNSFLLFRKHI